MQTILSTDQVEAFARDGYLVLSGMLDDDLLDRLCRAGDEIVRERAQPTYFAFSVIERGCIFDPPVSECNRDVFRNVALQSKLARVAAELMQLDPEKQNCRLLRDVFLAKPVHANDACDWHVDDQGFWPAKFASEATAATGKDQHGVNVWLALDDMPVDCAGSMAVAPGSHRANWKDKAYKAIGQDRSVDKDWTRDEVASFFANLRKGGTCHIGQTDASLREQIERTGVVLDVKRGDAVFCTRLLFHRTLDVTEKGKTFYTKASLNRYSLRYVPGSTRVPGKYNSLEWSVLLNPDMAGKSLDEIVNDGAYCWYPRVWPALEDEVEKRLDDVAMNALHAAKGIMDEERSVLLELARAIKEKQEVDGEALANQSTPEVE